MANPQTQEVKAQVSQIAPVVEAKGLDMPGAQLIPRKRQDEMLGKVADEPAFKRQRYYFLELNLEGEPVGSVLREAPKDKPYISVSVVLPEVSSLVTPSGAPLTEQMNPDHSFFDPALAARNPVPEHATPKVGDVITRNSNLKGGAENLHVGDDAKPQPPKESDKKHETVVKK